MADGYSKDGFIITGNDGNHIWGGEDTVIIADADYILPVKNKRHRMDNAIINKGESYLLKKVSANPDRETGDYTIEDLFVVKMKRLRKRANTTGKTESYFTTFKAFRGIKPQKGMRFIREGVEREIVDVDEEGANAFVVTVETR